MIDRKKAPDCLPIDHISFVSPQVLDVSEQVKLYWMNEVPNDTASLTLFFNAGSIRGTKNIPALVNSLLLSGTKNASSTQVHENIDSLGGYIDTAIGQEGASLTIYSLKDYLLPIAHIVADAIENLEFHESEVTDLLSSSKQKMQIELQKVSYLANREFKKQLFQSNLQYAKVTELEDFDSVNRDDLKQFWKNHYLHGLRKIHVVGDLNIDHIDAIIDVFGKMANDSELLFESNFEFKPNRIDVPLKDALQCSIKMGRQLFNRTHSDYLGMMVLNTILGDYFGSRLMANVREDKGYTYGIGSGIVELKKSGYFVISTSVKKEVLEETLVEIKKEINRLQTELIGDDELELVKNYLLGQLLKSADGPYAMLSMYAQVKSFDLDLSYYQKMMNYIQSVQPQELKKLAVQYLNWEDFLIVTAGK